MSFSSSNNGLTPRKYSFDLKIIMQEKNPKKGQRERECTFKDSEWIRVITTGDGLWLGEHVNYFLNG